MAWCTRACGRTLRREPARRRTGILCISAGPRTPTTGSLRTRCILHTLMHTHPPSGAMCAGRPLTHSNGFKKLARGLAASRGSAVDPPRGIAVTVHRAGPPSWRSAHGCRLSSRNTQQWSVSQRRQSTRWACQYMTAYLCTAAHLQILCAACDWVSVLIMAHPFRRCCCRSCHCGCKHSGLLGAAAQGIIVRVAMFTDTFAGSSGHRQRTSRTAWCPAARASPLASVQERRCRVVFQCNPQLGLVVTLMQRTAAASGDTLSALPHDTS